MAQYSYSTFQAPFQYLTNPDTISLNAPDWDDNEFNMAIGFPVNVLGTAYDSMVVEANGAVVLHNGLTYGSLFSTTDTFPALMPFGEFLTGSGDLRYRTMGNSPISYEITGLPGTRIAKVEWRNAGFYNDPNNYSDSVNFQVWIYETTGDIEFRYGSSRVSTESYSGLTGPTVGIAPFESDPNYMMHPGYYLTGDSTNASVGSAYAQLTGTPVDGTVFRFASTITVGVKDALYAQGISVYPNPAADEVRIALEVTGMAVVNIADITGRIVHTETIEGYGKATAQVYTSHLAPGLYVVTSGGSSVRLIIK